MCVFMAVWNFPMSVSEPDFLETSVQVTGVCEEQNKSNTTIQRLLISKVTDYIYAYR